LERWLRTDQDIYIADMALPFTWDDRKAAANLRKHGVSFAEAASAFGDPLSIAIPDPGHSVAEERLTLIEKAHSTQIVVVAHVERGDTIRIISAPPATRRERIVYEEGN
jgi:hypothetical protein